MTRKRLDENEVLAIREQYREEYLRLRDPISEDRMLWRAQTFRHLMHLLPGQTILELGCGDGVFTRRLSMVSRGENPITAVSFGPGDARPKQLPMDIEFLRAASLPGPLADRTFDFIVVMDLLDQSNCISLLQNVYRLLKPGGQVLFYQSNPWNIVLRVRRIVSRLFGGQSPRSLLSRPQLFELMSEIGSIWVFSVYNDFVYAPLTRQLIWFLRNLSIVLENMPGVRTLAGAILLHAQKPPRRGERPATSLFAHEHLRRAVSIVIPCHNEQMNIGPLVTELLGLFDEYIHEIIPVEDNSTDNTAEVMRKLARETPGSSPFIARRPAAWDGPLQTAIAPQPGAIYSRWTATFSTCFRKCATSSTPQPRDTMSSWKPILTTQRPAELSISKDRGEPGLSSVGSVGSPAPFLRYDKQPQADS